VRWGSTLRFAWAALAQAALLAGAPAQQTAQTEPVAETQAASPAPTRRFWVDTLPFIPVPEIDTAPQSGVTLGLIPVFLSHNEQGQIDRILAPDIIHSEYFGWGARWRTFGYPSEDERWSVVAGAKEHVEREFDARFDQGLLRNGDWSWGLHAMIDRSGTSRFYGLGNDSLLSNQTSFVDSQARLEGSLARKLAPAWQLAYLACADSVRIEHSNLDSLPSIETRFAAIAQAGDAGELQQRVSLVADTRDSTVLPRQGGRFAAFAGFSSEGLAGNVSYSYLGLDGTWLEPAGPRITLVGHAALRYMLSYRDAPFWALSSLGGDRSAIAEAQPLRAYGPGRYVDRNGSSVSLEARSEAGRFHGLDTDLEAEVAPFVDAGKVFDAMNGSPVSHAHVGEGLGLRLLARPFIVGYLDVAHGAEGFAVFSGIDYPF
jgi:hypothetical protein